ncbi:MAG: FAD-binding oxidoreductase [Acidobacteriota bacterium]
MAVTVISPELAAAFERIVGPDCLRRDEGSRVAYGTDGTKRSAPADLVAIPSNVGQVAAIARLCNEHRIPLVPRGAGTGYSGGAVPTRGGVVLSLERLNRILEIDERDLVAVVEPCVLTGALQEAVERVGLFYPPDPASLAESSLGGNIAENAGGPRGFKYGSTRNYVLGLEAVLPTGEIIRTGGRTVKNVAGYDLTSLIVGCEGTLAIVTQAILRLIPKPPASATLRATFMDIRSAASGVDALLRARVVPASIELIDGSCLASTGAMLLIEVDGQPEAVEQEAARVESACTAAGAVSVARARTAAEREELWRVRRELSPMLRQIAPVKVNNDIVVPRGRIPELFDFLCRLAREHDVKIPSFGHAGDGNIHVNIMVEDTEAAVARAKAAERELFQEVVRLGGAITGEHGIGFVKAPFLGLQLSEDEIALMRRIKAAFDPNNILNPGKIFTDHG